MTIVAGVWALFFVAALIAISMAVCAGDAAKPTNNKLTKRVNKAG